MKELLYIMLVILLFVGLIAWGEVSLVLSRRLPERVSALEKKTDVLEEWIIGNEGCFHKIQKIRMEKSKNCVVKNREHK